MRDYKVFEIQNMTNAVIFSDGWDATKNANSGKIQVTPMRVNDNTAMFWQSRMAGMSTLRPPGPMLLPIHK